MSPSFSREFLLAAACSAWPPSSHRNEAIRRAAADPLDWDRFLRVVARHQVVGLVHDGLTSARPEVHPEIARDIRNQAAALVRENLILAAEAVRLQRMFSEANLPVAFIKGVSLAELAFGNLGLRQGKDLDLLVTPDSFPAAAALVERAGYLRFSPPAEASEAQLWSLMPIRKDFGFVHEGSRRELELHWRLFLNPHLMDETSLMVSSRIVPLSGTIGLRTLGEDDLFAYLCAHGALHWWYQLKWLADIGALLARAQKDGVERHYRAAQTRGLERPAAQAILLCNRLLGTEVPDQLLASFRSDAILRWLESTALNAMTAGNSEIAPRDMLFGTTRGSLSSLLLSRKWRYWLAELTNHSICEADVLTLSLPSELKFLYPLLRLPFWLWRHRG
jgi:Uncharacterised nucleotidyltransferase